MHHNNAAALFCLKGHYFNFLLIFIFLSITIFSYFFRINRKTCPHFTVEKEKEKGAGFEALTPPIRTGLPRGKMQPLGTVLLRVCCIDTGMQFQRDFLRL